MQRQSFSLGKICDQMQACAPHFWGGTTGTVLPCGNHQTLPAQVMKVNRVVNYAAPDHQRTTTRLQATSFGTWIRFR